MLAVMWLSAALAAIGFSLANTVRGETERASTAVDGLRSQYLAEAAVTRATLYMDWGRFHPEMPLYKPPAPRFLFNFPEGLAQVELIPETSKFNLNTARPEDLVRLLLALGVRADQAQEIVAAIVDWRTPSGGTASSFDAYYESLRQPFRSPHTPFQDVEELLAVRGVTPDLFYGTWEHTPEGASQRLYARTGLRDCVSVYGATERFDINTAPPPVLAAIGVPPDGIVALLQIRRQRAFNKLEELQPYAATAGAGFSRLRTGGNSIFTLRATVRLRLANGQLSDLRRTVAAQVKFMPPGYGASYHILQWYENAPPQQP